MPWPERPSPGGPPRASRRASASVASVISPAATFCSRWAIERVPAMSKAFGESLGRLYHDRHALEVACLRIGTFADRPRTERHLSTWLSHRDAVQLVRRCLEAPSLGFLVMYGISANRRSWWQSPGWEVIGYRPQDDAESYAAEVAGKPAGYRFQGGEFSG